MADGKLNPLVFEHEMVHVTRTLSRDGDLRVQLSGTEASSENGVVNLPALDKTQELSQYDANVMRGYVDHEAAHERYTDKEWIQKAERSGPMVSMMVQALEDVRVEAIQNDKYAGAKVNLSATADATIKLAAERFEKGEYEIEDPKQILPLLTTMEARNAMGYTINGEALDALRKVADDAVRQQAKDVGEQARNLGSTEEAYKLALKIFDAEDPDEDESGGRGITGNGDSGGKGPGGDGAGGHGGDGSHTPVNVDMRDGVSQALGDKVQKHGSAEIPFVVNWEFDMVVDRHGVHMSENMQAVRDIDMSCSGEHTIKRLTGDHSEYNATKRSLGASVERVKTAFERLLMSQLNRDWDFGKEFGNLDPKRLANVATGSRNIKRQRAPRKELDTAVSLCIDMSSSMGGPRAELAQKAAIALAESLAKIGIPFEAVGYTTAGNPYQYMDTDDGSTEIRDDAQMDEFIRHRKGAFRCGDLRVDRTGKGSSRNAEYAYIKQQDGSYEFQGLYATNVNGWVHSRSSPVKFIVFKDFKDSLFVGEPGLGAISRSTEGGTPEVDGLMFAYQRILLRQEKRKVIVVINDGGPGSSSYADERRALKNLVQSIEAKKDVSIMQIGMMTKRGKDYYSDSSYIDDITELPKVLIEKASEVIKVQVAA